MFKTYVESLDVGERVDIEVKITKQQWIEGSSLISHKLVQWDSNV